jgi:uncharacterized protein
VSAGRLASPPHPPELPEKARPRWHPGYGFAAMAAGTGAVLLASIPLLPVALSSTAEGAVGALALLLLIGVQDAGYIAAAVGFAHLRRGRPRTWHFGLRATPPLRTGLITIGATLAILGFEVGFVELVGIDESDTDELGTDEGFIPAVAFSLAAIVIAPVAEEFFFRAFFYRALRNKLRVWSACLITSLVFAALHLQYIATPLVFVIIAVFAVGTCLVYEATGSLFAVIAIHAAFNTLATAGTDAGYAVPIAVGAAVLVACVLVPRRLGPAPSPFPRTALAR